MKIAYRIVSAVLVCAMLLSGWIVSGACAASAASGVLPVISITTENQGADKMDFVTKPVDPDVAASVASWTPGYVMPPAPYYEKCSITVTDADQTVMLEGVEAQVKVRGNWTTNYAKKPLRIKFQDKQSMLGLNGGAKMKSWVLLAEYKDLSMLRNRAAFQMSREILSPDGLYCADSRLVEVQINGEYWGVYLLTEQQQVNPNRISVSEPEKGYTGTDIGYFLEFDGYFCNEDPLQRFHVDYADNAPLTPFDGNGGSGRTMRCLPKSPWEPKKDVGFTVKNDLYSQEQNDFIAGFVNGVYRILYAAAYENRALAFNESFTELAESPDITPKEAVERVIDVQSLVDMYLISELSCDADIYWSSFFMDVDFSENGSRKLRFEAPWDFDSSLGNKNRCLDGTGFYAANIVPDVNGDTDYGGIYETINPWLAVLVYEDWFQTMVREKWTAVYDDGVFARALELIDAEEETYREAFRQNYQRWRNLADKSEFVGELSATARLCNTHAEAAAQLSGWLQSRVDFLNANWHL